MRRPTRETESTELTPSYSIDISEGWDTESMSEIFLRRLRVLPFYRSGLLYSGFDLAKVGKGKAGGSKEGGEDTVFCSTEDGFEDSEDNENPLRSCLNSKYKKPAIAVYDPSKMKSVDPFHGYHIEDPSALIAILPIKI